MTALRAHVIGNIASYRDCWAFRRKLAAQVGCSIRTVQRAITEAASKGLIGVARCKRGERPPGLDSEVPCGWSHRWIVGWGQVGAAVKHAVDAARSRWIVRRSAASCSPKVVECAGAGNAPTSRPRPEARTPRKWTAAELDQELARIIKAKPPP
jgi:hypothetical protein